MEGSHHSWCHFHLSDHSWLQGWLVSLQVMMGVKEKGYRNTGNIFMPRAVTLTLFHMLSHCFLLPQTTFLLLQRSQEKLQR